MSQAYASRLCTSAKPSCAVAKAQWWASELVRTESRGPGDIENAMRRLGARHHLSWREFWRLRYRPPHDIFVSVYDRLRAAYQAECRRQLRLLKHEIEITKLRAGAHSSAVRQAEALAREGRGQED